MCPLIVFPPSGELIAVRTAHFSWGSNASEMTWQPLASEPTLNGKKISPIEEARLIPIKELHQTFALILNADVIAASCSHNTELIVIEPFPKLNSLIHFHVFESNFLVQIVDLFITTLFWSSRLGRGYLKDVFFAWAIFILGFQGNDVLSKVHNRGFGLIWLLGHAKIVWYIHNGQLSGSILLNNKWVSNTVSEEKSGKRWMR